MRKVVMMSSNLWTSHNSVTQSVGASVPIRELWVVLAFVQVLYKELDSRRLIIG
jgi:hypothetical protein